MNIFKSAIVYAKYWLHDQYIPLIIIFLFALAIRLPLYHTPFWRTPDAIEYINIARNLVEGRGFVSSIKFTFFTNGPVVYPGLFDRPILTPILFSLVLFFNKNIYTLQLFLFFIESTSIVFFYLIARKLLTPILAFTVALIAACNANLVIGNRLIVSEPIYYCIILLAFVLYYYREKSAFTFSLLGFLSGLSVLVRPDGILLLVTFIIFSLQYKKQLLLLVVVFLLTISPVVVTGIALHRNPFHTVASYVFQVRSFTDGMTMGFDRTYPSTVTFISQNFFWIIGQIFRNILSSIESLITLPFLGLLVLVIPFIHWQKLRQFFPILFFAGVSFLILVASWGVILEPERHLGLVYVLLLLVLGNISLVAWRKKFILGLVVLSLTANVVLDAHRIVWARTQENQQDSWDPSQRGQLYSYVKQHTPQNAIIASPNPFLVNMFTDRPTILMPNNILDQRHFSQYISLYHVQYLLAENKQESDFFGKHAQKMKQMDGITVYKIEKPKL